MVATTSPSRPYRSAARDERARQTRARLLAAATDLILEHGYAGTTMRDVAARAEVSVQTVELLYGRKPRLLKAVIDVAIAGDAEPVPVLERDWTSAAPAAASPSALAAIAAALLAPAQARSAGLVLALLEGARRDPELVDLVDELVEQRVRTASWLVDQLARVGGRRAGCTRDEVVDPVWMLIDPAVFDRLTRQRGWSVAKYERWIADVLIRLATDGDPVARARRAKGTT